MKNNMLDFIKTVLEKNPNEEKKYELLTEIVEKEVSAKELAQIIEYIKEKQSLIINLPNSIDICGTWGSWLPRINTSTLTAIQLAKEWIKVTKHWNNASSGRFGSFDLIEQLQFKIPNTNEEIQEEYEKNNLVFLHAKKLYPFFRQFAEVRKKYAKPTLFNIIGPLLSPANSDFQMIGCSFEDKMELMIEACKILWRKNVMIVRGEDGLDEVTLTGKTKVLELKNNTIKEYEIRPEDFGFEACNIEDITAEKIEEKIRITKEILSWKCKTNHNNLVEINKKVALKFLKN